MAARMAGKVVRKIVSTPNAPSPVGPYSQAVVVDQTVYLAGQIGTDPKTGKFVSDSVVDQAKQTLINLGNVLEAAGSSFNKVVKTTVLLADIKDFQAVNDVYSQFFKEKFPARAAYQAAALPLGARVEIEAIAVAGDVDDQIEDGRAHL